MIEQVVWIDSFDIMDGEMVAKRWGYTEIELDWLDGIELFIINNYPEENN